MIWMYTFQRFTPRMKKQVLHFFESLSLDTRKKASVSGVDANTLYFNFRQNWREKVAVVLLKDTEVIAVGELSPCADGYEMQSVFVRDDLQHKGIGTKLVKYLFALSLLNGKRIIYASVLKDNYIALDFYKKLGFRIIGRNEIVYKLVKRLDMRVYS